MAEHNAIDCATVIGNDVVIKGEITVEKGLRVDGRIEGAVTTKGRVHIGKTGQLAAEINSGSVIVEGKIKGNIIASERVTLEATSNVCGDLTSNKLIVNEGATFVGKINVGPDVLKGVAPVKDSAMTSTVASRPVTQMPASGSKH